MPAANHWQNNHRTAEGRHHTCSGNTADMCGTGIGHKKAAIHAVRKSFEDTSECLLLVDADNAFNKLNRKVSLESRKHQKTVFPHVHTPTKQLQHTRHALSGKIVTTYCHRRVWHKETMQLWQCMPYPHNHWYKPWATKLHMMKWNRHGMQMIALQSDHWQE